jgi:hypothetical protein
MVVIPLKWTTQPVSKRQFFINENDVLSSIICGIGSQFMMYMHHFKIAFEDSRVAELT